MFIARQRRGGQGGAMLAGLLVAIALLAPVAGEVAAKAEPAAAATADLAPTTDGPANDGETKAANRCPTLPNAQPGEIVICAQRPEGYRLDPDVLEANRAKRSGRPKRPERMRDTSCASVGPMGCMGAGAGVNLLGAALTAAEMAARLATGKEIGSLFVTDPQPTEYQLYVEAKRRREAREAEAAAAAKAKAAAQVRAKAKAAGAGQQGTQTEAGAVTD